MKTVTLVEACTRLRVAYVKAHRWALTGRLEASKGDDGWRVSEASVKRVAKELQSERDR